MRNLRPHRVNTLLFLIFAALFVFQGVIFAQITGKIAGTVFDAESGEPLPGVNVQIEGTTFGGATDLEGDYYILNIPTGATI